MNTTAIETAILKNAAHQAQIGDLVWVMSDDGHFRINTTIKHVRGNCIETDFGIVGNGLFGKRLGYAQ